MLRKDDIRLRIGVLGCGPIAQAAHSNTCTKARNADLYAICDVADDLRARMAATFAPQAVYADYAEMLADPHVDAVIIATSDVFHVKAAAIGARRRASTCCAKSRSASPSRKSRSLRGAVKQSRKNSPGRPHEAVDPGIQAAKAFMERELGQLLAFKGWYCDSTHRYAMTDTVQPLDLTSANARKPTGNPKADLQRYYMLAHGSHLSIRTPPLRPYRGGRGQINGTLRRLLLVCRPSSSKTAPSAIWTSLWLSAWIGTKAFRSMASMAASSQDLQPLVLQEQRG